MTRRPGSFRSFLSSAWARVLLGAVAGVLAGLLVGTAALAAPKVVIISLDGATPRFVDQYLASGALGANTGLGLLQREGLTARQNVTISPSLTAPGHIAIATGSRAANNDIVANTFHLVASPFIFTISGFAAPIGGYAIDGPAPSPVVTAEPVWLGLRAARKIVVAATFPGADGLDVRVPGVPNSPIVQPAAERTVDYTVPFGAFAGLGAQGFSLTAAQFGPAPATTIQQLAAAGRTSFSPVLQKVTALEQFSVGGVSYTIQVAALDTTDDGQTNYDTLVFFDATQGIPPGPLQPPVDGSRLRAGRRQEVQPLLPGGQQQQGRDRLLREPPRSRPVRGPHRALLRQRHSAQPARARRRGRHQRERGILGAAAGLPDPRAPQPRLRALSRSASSRPSIRTWCACSSTTRRASVSGRSPGSRMPTSS